MGSSNDNPAKGKTGSASRVQGEGDHKAAREYDADTRNFIETHDVTKLARKAAPGSGEEAADLLQAEEVGRSHASGVKSSPISMSAAGIVSRTILATSAAVRALPLATLMTRCSPAFHGGACKAVTMPSLQSSTWV